MYHWRPARDLYSALHVGTHDQPHGMGSRDQLMPGPVKSHPASVTIGQPMHDYPFCEDYSGPVCLSATDEEIEMARAAERVRNLVKCEICGARYCTACQDAFAILSRRIRQEGGPN